MKVAFVRKGRYNAAYLDVMLDEGTVLCSVGLFNTTAELRKTIRQFVEDTKDDPAKTMPIVKEMFDQLYSAAASRRY